MSVRERKRISLLGPDCYSVCSPSMCTMLTEYIHCQELNCQTLVILNSPATTAKTGRKMSTAFFSIHSVSIKEPL